MRTRVAIEHVVCHMHSVNVTEMLQKVRRPTFREHNFHGEMGLIGQEV